VRACLGIPGQARTLFSPHPHRFPCGSVVFALGMAGCKFAGHDSVFAMGFGVGWF
jgi:hypothetical protein